MPITTKDIISIELSDKEIYSLIVQANNIALNITDRPDLHERDHLERVFDSVLGDIAEYVVIKWLKSQGKSAVCAVDKSSTKPDLGHDVVLNSKTGSKNLLCSIKSSISAFKDLEGIINEFTLATKSSELRDVNIQVYFWLQLKGGSYYRRTVPSTKNMAIVGWFSKKDLERNGFSSYSTEGRKAPNVKLANARPMYELLDYLV